MNNCYKCNKIGIKLYAPASNNKYVATIRLPICKPCATNHFKPFEVSFDEINNTFVVLNQTHPPFTDYIREKENENNR